MAYTGGAALLKYHRTNVAIVESLPSADMVKRHLDKMVQLARRRKVRYD